MNILDLNNGKVKVKRSWLDKNFLAVMPESLFWKLEDAQGYLTISKSQMDKMQRDLQQRQEKDRILHETAGLNNKGMAQEKSGDIKGAIKTYEQNIKLGYAATHSFDRLMILYRKEKDYINEERVILKALTIFSDEVSQKKYSERLEKVQKLKGKTKFQIAISKVKNTLEDSDYYCAESF